VGSIPAEGTLFIKKFAILVGMNPEEKRLLEDNLRISKENQKMIKSLYKRQLLATVWSVLKWTVIIIALIWSWYVVQPLIEQTQAMYQQVQQTTETVGEFRTGAGNVFGGSGLQDMLNVFRMGSQQ